MLKYSPLKMVKRPFAPLAGLLLIALLAGCASAPPRQSDDLCAVFHEKTDWYAAAVAAEERWGAPVHVTMAIIRHESSYREDARPPREYLLGLVPWFRPSSAFGFAQAKDETWDWYRESSGNRWADRDEFDDAVDFVGWYLHQSQRMLGLSKWDAYSQYLAYHEGQGGYKRGSYRNKGWLLGVARRVSNTAKGYATQLASCRKALEREASSWWPF